MSPYKLARKILPLKVQAWLGNRHKVKRRTLDPLLFNFTAHPQEQRLIYEKWTQQNVPIESLEQHPFIAPEIAASYRQWYSKSQVQAVIKVCGDIFIEPATGWPMGSRNQLYLSLHPSGISPYMPVPAYQTIFNKTPLVTLDKVISLRDVNEAGYSHFYTDLMGKLELIRSAGCNLKEYTIVVSKKIAETKYGQFLLAHSPLFTEIANVFLQDGEFIACKEAIFANVNSSPTNGPLFKAVAKNAKAACPPKTETAETKIFLTRGRNRRRTMRNSDVVGEIACGKGFKVVDADQLSLPEQIELFANCRHLIGIHGAGLVNMLYRYENKLSLFEIREPIRPVLGLNACYHSMALALGFDYGTTVGEDFHGTDDSFMMSPDRFEADFDKFWAVHGT